MLYECHELLLVLKLIFVKAECSWKQVLIFLLNWYWNHLWCYRSFFFLHFSYLILKLPLRNDLLSFFFLLQLLYLIAILLSIGAVIELFGSKHMFLLYVNMYSNDAFFFRSWACLLFLKESTWSTISSVSDLFYLL